MARVWGYTALVAAVAAGLALACAAKAFAPSADLFFSFEKPASDPAEHGNAQFGVAIAGGPSTKVALTAKPGVGFDGLHSLHYMGNQEGEQRIRLYDIPDRSGDYLRLSYVVFPQSVPGDLRNLANYIAVDLLFDDGTRLSGMGTKDQHRVALDARAQGDARVLYPDQWNYVSVDLGRMPEGRRLRAVELVHNGPAGAFEGYIDSIRIEMFAPANTVRRPSDRVNTLRGTNSNGNFSRGNNFPATALPHGFNFWTPVTNAGANWIYQYQERNNDQNRPRLEALALSHEPSPWMGDRQTFQLMPAAVEQGAPSANREKRALSFSHDMEDAHPYVYRVQFDNGIRAEVTPTDHAAMFRFRFEGNRSQLILDNRDNHGSVTIDAASNSFSGYSDVKSRLSTGATRLFFYAVADQPIRESGRLTGEGRDAVTAWIGFDTRKTKEVTLRVATSLLSIDQARRNLELEIAASDTFDTVKDRAQKIWDEQLGIVEVKGASDDELTTLYSNLYRLFLYPNSASENTGTADAPAWKYASPFSPATSQDTPTATGAHVLDGKVYVNNGFWDTYRTAWPAYTLLTPHKAGEMIDGFVQQYRDGGWIARWSSPGYADLMVGTSSDVAFADAWLKGVRNFDVQSFYDSAIRDASVVSPIKGTGRKGIKRANFNGYTDTAVNEGLSWSMDGYINDFAIGNLAKSLTASSGDTARYEADATYYGNRALGYVHLFHPELKFFIGRDAKGAWRYDRSNFNPERWGGDYTETNAWNMAFHAPQDGAGLAALYGGRDKLAAKIDQFFATPGNFDVGSYGEVIHEMLEARDVRMGQYGHSNQPSHHIIYMYDEAGQPWKTQDKVRDVLSRLYVGSEIGQGYPGDEDNGEMSAWWIFSAAGFYPLRMGTPEYVIGAPYFPHMDIRLENGAHIVIDAPKVSDTNRYVQSLRVNGQAWNSLTLPHALLAKGATLEFDMGPKPSKWGTGTKALPASITREGERPAPMTDLLDGHADALSTSVNVALAPLVDNDATTTVSLPAGASIQWQASTAEQVAMYTLTSGDHQRAPAAWRLEGSRDGKQWSLLDERSGERFAWDRQTRPFLIAHPDRYRYYRLTLSSAVELAELELLGAKH
ncbi:MULTISPECIES: GH92 family glycosyl hydrolase [Dyella]|uniref:Glycoside hydrolase family 92 protein n=2 Tax=Dyella TaxID=231454 RepID=A0A4R0YNB9_9GAMM|nr:MULTISPECIES: GH92 family glycosyl hydrolase [Dyella]TBR37104.1 glycoside hydrolase family 92 protein [Dyella terrae]TCI07806.1 glycoside hydrolase family 92 protein [Dyella soli]